METQLLQPLTLNDTEPEFLQPRERVVRSGVVIELQRRRAHRATTVQYPRPRRLLVPTSCRDPSP